MSTLTVARQFLELRASSQHGRELIVLRARLSVTRRKLGRAGG